jgi:sarcosine oxidase, subunit beta
MPTPLRAHTVVIGGGIIGIATAFELARRQAGKVVLVERETLLGTGATARCAGGIRAQFSSEINCRISQLSEQIFMNFEAEVGVPAAYDQVGYLFCLTEPSQVDAFRRDLAMWQTLGLPAVWLSTEEIRRRVPELETADLLGGTFCGTDGLADSGEFMTAYESQARRLGVTILAGQAVTGVRTSGGRVTAVEAGSTVVETERAINCAGPYAAEIGRLVGLDIPIAPLKRQICKTAPLDWVRADLPMIVDIGSGLYMHKESGGMLMGWADPSVSPGYDQSTDASYTDEIIMRALARLPRLEEAAIANAWGGLYETTPDHHAIMGPVEGLEGFWISAGFSGHGFMHAPGAARLLAEWIVDGRPSIDLSRLSFERFSGAPAWGHEVNVI